MAIPSPGVAPTLVAPENDYRSIMGREVESPELSVAVVIPVYNRTGLLERTLAGIAAQTYPRDLLTVFVADDGSTEDVDAAVDRSGGELRVTVLRRAHEGYGAGQARNLGAAAAVADVLVFFDADCIPDHDAVERHAVWHHLATNLVVIGSRHHIDTSRIEPDDIASGGTSLRLLAFETEEPESEAWVSRDHRAVLHRRTASLRNGDMAFRSLVSSNFSVRRDGFVSSGGFSEDFTRWGGEDTELGWRLWNSGTFFIDEPRAAIYHQVQEDLGAEGWRAESRAANEGLIQSKIPHRHYRRDEARVINETPKVSLIVHSPEPDRLGEIAEQALAQRLNDIEIIVAGNDKRSQRFVERRKGDPRFGMTASVEDAVRRSTGEFVALVHGATGLDHRLISRSVAALERRPSTGWVRSAYGIPTTEGLDVYRRSVDTSQLDRAWGGRLPLFGLTRRRDLMKCLRDARSAEQAWAWVVGHLEPAAHGIPLVIVPAETPATERPASVRPPTSLRSMVMSDIKAGGRKAVTAPIRAAGAAILGNPYRTTPVAPAESRRYEAPDRLSIRYVGWTGRQNFGDEAMLSAVSRLFSWAEMDTEGENNDLLMLGGGTLINRGYLRHLRPLDSPRIERVTFGTGVANPDYWGEPREKPSDWIDFLSTCAYVGVRGPMSRSILEEWGSKREIEIVGDPALSLTPDPKVEQIDGRIVVCPAWSRGLLWGDSDEDVIGTFARLVERLRATGHDVWALSAFPGDDRHIIDMMRKANASDLPYLAAHDEPQAGLDLLASAQLVVSERLHGAVLAAAAGVVPVMVEYRPKLRDFGESVGLGELVIRTDSLSGDSLIELVEDAYRRRFELAPGMTERVEAFRSRQSAAADSIHKIMQS